MSVLADLLHPYCVEDFFTHHWTKRSIAVSGKEQRQFEHLFSWEALTHLLNFHQISHPDLRLALNGKVLDESENANLNHWFQQGATVILNQVHKRVPAIAQFAAALRQELGYSTQVNAYGSFPEKQGFSAHYDTHEVFILQVEGTKQWFVFTDTMSYPLVDQKSSSLPVPETPPYLSYILHPGDVLYIPRGHWHYAVALNQPSLHLTLGVHCKTGIDWLEWMLGELRQAESWRESLPLCANPEGIQSHLNRLIQDLSDRLAQPDNGDRYIRYMNSLGKPIAPYALPSQAGFELFPQGIQTTFTKSAFHSIQISELPDAEGYKILTVGKEILLKGVNAILIEKLFSQGQFSGETLMNGSADYDWELDLMPLLSRLVMEGILICRDRALSQRHRQIQLAEDESTIDKRPAIRKTTMNKFFCAEASRQVGESMIGSASPYETYILIECPTPWAPAAFDSPQIPVNLKALVEAVAQEKRSLRFLLITRHPHVHPHAPLTKVLIYEQEKQAFSGGYRQHEFEVSHLDRVASVIQSYLAGKFLTPGTSHPHDFLICTHGSHDKCCAKYGLPFYREAIATPLQNLRIWQSSHFGGHRFAPTAISLPDGRYYGGLDIHTFKAIATRTGDIHSLTPTYRGWSILPLPLQIMERELLLRCGWDWFNCNIAYRVLNQNADATLIQAELSCRQPDQTIQVYRADLVKDDSQSVCLKGSCGALKESLFAKYTIANLQLYSVQVVCFSKG